MAEEVNINISITTNAAPVADKISKELDGVKKKAKEVKDELAEALDQPTKGDSKIKEGTRDLETLKKTVSPIKGLINDLTGGMSDAFFQAYDSVKAATAGVKGLDLALKTAAFGIAILVIQSVIQLYDELVQSEEEEAEALAKASEAKKKYVDETRASADALDAERKARDGASNQIKREVAELEASGAAAEDVYAKRKELLNKDLQDLIAKQAFLYDDAEQQKKIAQDILDKKSEIRQADLAEQRRIREKRAADAKAAAEKAKRERENALAERKALIAAIEALDRETANVRAAIQEGSVKDERELENIRFENIKAKLKREQEAEIKAAEGKQTLIDAINRKYQALGEQAEQNHQNKLVDIDKQAADKITTQNERAADINRNLIENEQERQLANLQAAFEKEYKEAEGNKELQLALEKKYAKDVNDVRTKAQEDQLAKDKAYRQQLQELAVSSALSIISSLKELNNIYDTENKEAAQRAFNRTKALNIAETIISTYATAQKAYASQFTPVPTPDSAARGAIAAGIAIAGGLARVAAISAQKFQWTDQEPSTPSVAGAAGGGGNIPQPQFNIVGQSGTNQLATSIGAQFDQPIRAYVVGGEVSTAQELERRRVRTATFG